MRRFFPLAQGGADTLIRIVINPVDTPVLMRGGVRDRRTDSLTVPGEQSIIFKNVGDNLLFCYKVW